MSHEPPSSSLFGEAASARQLIIRAERQRERQLASLFYETAGGAPGGRRRRGGASGAGSRGGRRRHGRGGAKRRGRGNKRAGTNAAAAGGQAFAGARASVRRKNQRSQARKHTKKWASDRPLGPTESSVVEQSSSGSAASDSLRLQRRRRQNMTPGGTPLMSQSLPVLTAAGSELSDVWKGKTTEQFSGTEPNHAWESHHAPLDQRHHAEDLEMTRFKHLGEAEASLRLPPTPDTRPPLTDAYKSHKHDRTHATKGSAGGLETPASSPAPSTFFSVAGGIATDTDVTPNTPLRAAGGAPHYMQQDSVGSSINTLHEGFPRPGGQTLGGFNLPVVEKPDTLAAPANESRSLMQREQQHHEQQLPVVVSIGSIGADQLGEPSPSLDAANPDHLQYQQPIDTSDSSYLDYQMATDSMLPPHHLEKSSVSSLYKSLRGQQQRMGLSPTLGLSAPRPGSPSRPNSSGSPKRKRAGPLVDTLDPRHPAVAEHLMHHVPGGQPGGAGRRVAPDRYNTVTDRVAGVLTLRTEQLQREIDAAKGGERKLLERIENGITWSRRSLLPLDFVFRKALARFRRSHLESAVASWLGFVRRSRTIEKLLAKVTPYCVQIQKCWRGRMGRKRARVVREIFRVELEQRREGAVLTLQVWWRRQVVKMKIKDRFIHNVARRRNIAAGTIQRIWTGFTHRLTARNRFRGARLTPAMHEIIKYRTSMEDADQLEVLKLTAVLFDQRNDAKGAATPGMPKHTRPYTMKELKGAEKKALALRDKRRREIKRKKEKWNKEAAEDRMELRANLTRLEKDRHELEMTKQRARVAEEEAKRVTEVARVKKAREEMRLMKEREVRERQERETRELERIQRMRDERARAQELEAQAKHEREEAEKVALARIREQVEADRLAHAARMEAKQRAFLNHQGGGGDDAAPTKMEVGLGEASISVDTEKNDKQQEIEEGEQEMIEMQGGELSNGIMSPEIVRNAESDDDEAPPVEEVGAVPESTSAATALAAAVAAEAVQENTNRSGKADEKEAVRAPGDGAETNAVEDAENGSDNTTVEDGEKGATSESQSTVDTNTPLETSESADEGLEKVAEIDVGDADAKEKEDEEKDKPRRGGGDLFSIVCVEDFEKDQNDEVDLKIGDPVKVFNREDPDWWIGENESTGARGTFPASAVKRQGVMVRPREDFTPDPEDEDEQISFEFGDFIEVLEWDDPEWWRGRNISSGQTGEFPSDMVFMPDEWAAEEARVAAEFSAEEDRLKKDELEKMEKLTRGLAADDRADTDSGGTADSRRAMRTLFSIMDWNSNGTVERYDMLRAVTLDTDRRSAMIELGLGRLRYWLLPSQWTRLFALMQYEQSCIDRGNMINRLPVVRAKIPGFEAVQSVQTDIDVDVLRANQADDVIGVQETRVGVDLDLESSSDAIGVEEPEVAAKIVNGSSADPADPADLQPAAEEASPDSTGDITATRDTKSFERGEHEVSVVVRRRVQRSGCGEAVDASTVNVDVVDDCGRMHRLRLPLKLLRSHSPGIEDLTTVEHVSELVRWLAYRDVVTSDFTVIGNDGNSAATSPAPKYESSPAGEPQVGTNDAAAANSRVLVFLPLFEAQEYAAAMASSAATSSSPNNSLASLTTPSCPPEHRILAQFQSVSPPSRPPSAGPVAVFNDDSDANINELEMSRKEEHGGHDKMSEVLKEEAKNKEEIAKALATIKEAGVSVPTSPLGADGKEEQASFSKDIAAAMFVDAAVSIDAKAIKAANIAPLMTEETKTVNVAGAVKERKMRKKKKKKKILPYHAHSGGSSSIGFAAFATVLRNPERVAARWELATRLHRRQVIYEESRIKASEYVDVAMNNVDPPTARKRRAREAKAARLADRNNMIRAAVALIEAVNARSELKTSQKFEKEAEQEEETVAGDLQGLDATESREYRDITEVEDAADISLEGKQTTTKLLEQEEDGLVDMVDAVATTRAKLLHFLAVARLPKVKLAQNYELLRPLLASSDGAGGFTALHPNVVKSLMVGSPEDIVPARAILPTLGFDPRNDLRTLERLPQFSDGD